MEQIDGEEPMQIIRQIADVIVSLPAGLRSGSLRIFGTWLDKPLDDEMTITDATVAGDSLELRFEGGEILQIWEPGDFAVRSHVFRIAGASRVLYRWYSYGEPKTPENLLVMDYVLEEGRVIRKSSAPWSPPVEDLGAAVDAPAVELVRPGAALTGLPGPGERRESADRRRGDVAHIVAQINASLEGLKACSLRIFGDGFARPLDHARKISGAFTGDGYLVLTFAFGETLTIWDPGGYEGGPNLFRIARASKVSWEWYLYGGPEAGDNHFFREYATEGDRVATRSNCTLWAPDRAPRIEAPAVELS